MAILRVRARSGSSGIRGRTQSRTLSHLAQKQVDRRRKAQLGGAESVASRFVRRAPAQSRSSWLYGLTGYALSGAGASRWLGRQRARVGSQSFKTQGLAGYARHALRRAGAARCLGRQSSLSRARSVEMCWPVVQGTRSTSSSWGSCLDSCSTCWSVVRSARSPSMSLGWSGAEGLWASVPRPP